MDIQHKCYLMFSFMSENNDDKEKDTLCIICNKHKQCVNTTFSQMNDYYSGENITDVVCNDCIEKCDKCAICEYLFQESSVDTIYLIKNKLNNDFTYICHLCNVKELPESFKTS